MSDKKRVQFDFNPEALQRLENLQKRTESATYTQVVRDALKLYDWLTSLDPRSLIEITTPDGENIVKAPIGMILNTRS